MQKTLIFILLALFFVACDTTKKSSNSGEKKPHDSDKMVMSGHIVEKEFILKNGASGGFTELYFRASVQDYFIKFCESGISKSDLEPFVDKVVTVEAEIVNGEWDICPDDPAEMQSRIGYYMVVKKLL